MSLTPAQRGVARGAIGGLAATLAALGLAWFADPFAVLFPASMHRVQTVALAALLPALSLVVCIGRLAQHRFHTPQDIDGSGLTSGTESARLLQALLQNTLEQVVLAMPVYAAWGAFAPNGHVQVVLMAALLFLAGRIRFFQGYHRGAAGRALGFALTFYPSVAMLLGTAVLIANTALHAAK